ncbi:hypothetical protein C4587_00270 [Candidatus Parcubacteria bacterium]|nr:MAG: hypothetical protein C4587_00270 [Candidatus Parcubacteria bacterium]
MGVLDQFALILLGLALGAQVFLRPFWVRYGNLSWAVASVSVFSLALYFSWIQHGTWAASEYTEVFLESGYFFRYIGLKFFAPPLIAFFAAIFTSWAAGYFNRRFGERFFEPEEISLMRLGIFLTGYPGFFLYLALVFLGGTLLSSAYLAFSKERTPFYYLWLPLAIFAILMKIYVLPQSFLALFIIS